MTVDQIIEDNTRRTRALEGDFDPVSGRGAPGDRVEVDIPDLPSPHLWLPRAMLDEPLVHRLIRYGGAAAVADEFERLRCRHDFAYWCARYIYIKKKGGGDDITFTLTHPQRKFVDRLEEARTSGRPIRIVLLKARQWGGSTVSQIYMAWLQLMHCTGLNSLIIAHQGSASDEIKDMFDRAIGHYPLHLLHRPDDEYKPNEKKMVTVGRAGCTFRVPQRNCKIKIGTAERPDSCRGGDYNLVHLSEVGLWKTTLGKKPEDIVRAACAGVMYAPNTIIVYESTANGVGNFFHREYIDARDNPRSQFRSLFVAWYEIEQNRLSFANDAERHTFAENLLAMREQTEAPSNREEPGRYLWWLWQQGATLEGINWYITERAKHSQHGSMAAECPSDDTEAFVNSGASVFDKYKVEALRADCSKPSFVGEIYAGVDTPSSPGAISNDIDTRLDNLRFRHDRQGNLWVWKLPDSSNNAGHRVGNSPFGGSGGAISDRYLAVVDIGGRSHKSDWSVIVVFDRMPMLTGGVPEVVAQWYGHSDMDLLAWNAARIAAFYDNALLVIESNTLETHDRERQVDGDQSRFVLNQIKRVYDNLYARRASDEDVRQGRPVKYGFHTNISTKPMVISTLVKVVRDRLYTERDERCLNEYLVYERRPNGSYGAITGAHDDLLMTRAIGMHICYYEMPRPALTTADYTPRFTQPHSEATL